MCVLSYAQRTVALRAPLCRGFFRQEPWRGLPFPIPGALTNGKIQDGIPYLLHLLHWQADSVPLGHLESPCLHHKEKILLSPNPQYLRT